MREKGREAGLRWQTGTVNLRDYKTNLLQISSEDVTHSSRLYVYGKKLDCLRMAGKEIFKSWD